MSNRTAVGALTISDIADGVNPISAVLTNQNHTFATPPSGSIATGEKNAFDCSVLIFVGNTTASYSSSLASNNTFRVDTFAGRTTGWGLLNTDGVLTMNTTPTGTGNKGEIFDIVITVKNSIGNTTTLTLVLTVNKAIEGAGGSVISMNPNRFTFQFAEGATESEGTDIIIPVTLTGNMGSLTIQYSRNGGTWTGLAQGSTANKAKVLSISDDSTDNDTITISKANFGSSDTFAIKIEGSAGAIDVISLVKIQDGNTGAASLHVTITSSTGGNAFKNNTGAAKTLTAIVFDMATGAVVAPSRITYQWKHDGLTTSDAASGSEVMSKTQTQVVTFSMIDNNGSNEITCEVTVAPAA